ncbi:MAG: L-histidine N(alpha)-methyltransferase [Myxococcaceae bacterium]|nr:L-histidine N(alpha)-methyltransferase [Myxococcaceae bacterium]
MRMLEGGIGEEGPRLKVLFDEAARRRALMEEARAGLTAMPKALSPRWLYDERGSLLFEEITRLEVYYPTRRERAILRAYAREIARLTRAETLVELGSGTSEKTRMLLTALSDLGTLRRFVPFDVSAATLRASMTRLRRDYPHLLLEGVVGDFEHHLQAIRGDDRRLIAFLGGTIGNLEPAPRARFLREVARTMKVGDALLLGTDLVKARERLLAAYDDPEGVTAAFNLNVLYVLNRELGARFDVPRFEHRVRFDEERAWIEMSLRSRCAQVVPVTALGLQVPFAEGEALRTEISAKFRPEQVQAELAAAGLRMMDWWTDDGGEFGVSLSTRR